MRSKLSLPRRLCLLLGLCLVLLGLALGAANLREEQAAGEDARALLREVDAWLAQPQEEPEASLLPAGEEAEAPAPDPWENYDVLGILTLPELGLRLPVLADCTEELLRVAPCRFWGEPEEGGWIVAGHNYRDHFGSLSALEPGDEASFSPLSGEELCYRVAALETVGASDWEALSAGEWDLTLFTCNLDMTKRIAVRCTLEG